MIRIDRIYFKKNPESMIDLSQLQQSVEKKIKEVASATRLRSTQDKRQLDVILGDPISLQTVNQIFKMLLDKRIKIKNFTWKPMKVGIFEIGILEGTVS